MTPILLAAVLAASAIVGTWERVAASPVSLMNSDPHGWSNHKIYYAPDGKVFLLEPEEKLALTTQSFRYRYDGKVRTLIAPDGQEHSNPVAIKGDVMTVTTDEGGTFTYRRMSGPRPWDRELEPRSVLVLASDAAQVREPAYDRNDYAKQPLEERVRGVWEVVRYSRVDHHDLPPYGFPNDKYIFDGKRVSMVAPNVTTIDPERSGSYRVVGNVMHVDDERWDVSFNKWGHLVLDQKEFVVTLKLIRKNTGTIPLLPVRIVLLGD